MKFKITCLVEDNAQPGSGLWSEHGISLWIETPTGTVLFDTASTERVFTHNLNHLGLDLEQLGALALSHAHDDHTGGLAGVLTVRKDLPVYAHPAILEERYSVRKGRRLQIGLSEANRAFLLKANLRLNTAPVEILPELWTSGEIIGREEQTGYSPNHFVKINGEFLADPYQDDMSLVLKTPEGLVLICGCCHAGLLNTLAHVQKNFSGKFIAVLGGTHLMSFTDPELDHILDYFKANLPDVKVYLNHCTGAHTIERLAQEFPSQTQACPAGTAINF